VKIESGRTRWYSVENWFWRRLSTYRKMDNRMNEMLVILSTVKPCIV